MTDTTPQSVLDFWFSDSSKKRWFNSNREFDQILTVRFESLWEIAAARNLDDWRAQAESALALIIVLDQFPLNMYRGQAKSFSSESYAIEITHHAIDNGFDNIIDKERVSFLYMPLMHSENIEDQNLSVALFEKSELEDNLRFAIHHRDIIKKHGRFPHRNSILGRTSRAEEIEYLNSPQAFKG